MVNLNSDIMYFFSKIVTIGSYFYVLTQGLALVLLLYRLVKKLTMQDKG